MTARSFEQIIKDSPSVGDVHIANTGGNGTRRRRGQVPVSMIGQAARTAPVGKSGGDIAINITVPISKIDSELCVVYGWATVNKEAGKLVTDHQGDQVGDAELLKAAHDFITTSRAGGGLHAYDVLGKAHRVGDIVESIVLTADVQKALGIDIGKSGWFVGYKVNDPDAWSLVKDGTLKAFSIGGRAKRVPL